MKRVKIMLITITAITVMTQSTFAADIPVESYPDNATDESVAITQNLIGGILDEVQNGLGYQPAWCKANNAVFAAVLANETGGYGYADLAAIARNAILQCRDMYLRPEYYAEKETAVRALIFDLINAVETEQRTTKPPKNKPIQEYIKRQSRHLTPTPTAWATSVIGIFRR